MKFSLLILIGLFIQNVNAYDKVNFVTNDGQIVISKDATEKLEDGKIIVYGHDYRNNRIEKVKQSERTFPKVGDKVKIYRNQPVYLDGRNYLIKEYKKVYVGEATIVAPELANSTYSSLENNDKTFKSINSIQKKFSEQELEKIKLEGIVAKPDAEIKVKKGDFVEV